MGGWVKCPIGNKKNWKIDFLDIRHYLITFFGEHSNVNNVHINALLYAFVLASMYSYSWLITFEIVRNFFFG